VLYATGEGVCDTCNGGDVFTSVGEAFRRCSYMFVHVCTLLAMIVEIRDGEGNDGEGPEMS
jgi:hypothetical protein